MRPYYLWRQNLRLIVCLATLLLLGVFIFVFKFSGNAQKAMSGEVLVAINDQVFIPDKITIAPGAKVTWVNEDEHTHWPASNPHPLHTGYPSDMRGCIGSALDACRGLAKGETFSFVFDKVGRWGMHDHLYPGITMEVVVISAGTWLGETNLSWWQKLLGQKGAGTSQLAVSTDPIAFRALDYYDQGKQITALAEHDPTQAWDFLKSVFIVKGVVVGNAHEFSHKIGNAAYAKYGFPGVKICDPAFAFGCFHGVTEKMLSSEGPSSIKKIASTCLAAFPPGVAQNSCIHGTGHGLYSWHNGNLMPALKDCDVLDKPYQTYCYDGVFMENSFNTVGQKITEATAWDFCKKLPEGYQYNCGRYQTFRFRESYGEDYKKIDSLCSLAPNETLADTCFMSLGFLITHNSLGKLTKIKNVCDALSSTRAKDQCFIGASKETKFQQFQSWEINSPQLCSFVSLSLQLQCK